MDLDYTEILSRLILGSSRYTAETLSRLHVGAVVCVAPADECREMCPSIQGSRFYRFPAAFTLPHEVCTRNLEKAVKTVVELIQEGITVYLHCLEGNVRSAAVAVMVVAKIKDVSVAEAFRYVSERRCIFRRCGYLDGLERCMRGWLREE